MNTLKQYSLFTIAALILVCISAYMILANKGSSAITGSKELSMLLYVEAGDVSYKTSDQSAFVKATSSPIVITTGTLVYTGLGRATILFPDNSSVVLDEYTELTVSYTEEKVSLFQTLGTTYHRVEALIAGGSYEVETPGTLAAVRGTKFAVKYDKKTKLTKVAVTEHRVNVSKFKEPTTATSTKEILESVDLEEGKTVRVSAAGTTATGSGLTIVETKDDKEMSEWVTENRQRDETEDAIKRGAKSKENIREAMKQLFEKDAGDGADSGTKEQTSQTDAKTVQDTQPIKPTEQKESLKKDEPAKKDPAKETVPMVKLSEEVFFDRFTGLFIQYFYLDEKDTPCTLDVSSAERVRVVASFAVQSGYPFTSHTLLSFAQDIEGYCKTNDASLKAKLQTRFDTEFPFKENI